MTVCCRTCNHRVHDMEAESSTPWLLDVSIIILTFKTAILCSPNSRSASSIALNTVLNDITDTFDQTPHHTIFTTWSPCLSNPKRVAILTTASHTCASSTSPIFAPVLEHLSGPPSVTHIFLDYSFMTLAPSEPTQRIFCEIMMLRAPNAGIAGAIGKQFGWAPKRSSLSAQLQSGAPVGFSRPGDLIRDFWAWAELRNASHPGSLSERSSSRSSEDEFVLKNTNSDEKNMAGFFPDIEEDGDRQDAMDDEMLVMIFQWRNYEGADRFKHPLQKSYGLNDQEVEPNLWDRHVAHPVRQLEGVGAQMDTLRLGLRGVEKRIVRRGEGGNDAKLDVRKRSGSRTLSVMATGIGERVSGLWR